MWFNNIKKEFDMKTVKYSGSIYFNIDGERVLLDRRFLNNDFVRALNNIHIVKCDNQRIDGIDRRDMSGIFVVVND